MTTIKLTLNLLRKVAHVTIPTHPDERAKLESDKLKHLLRAIMITRPDEIGCDECFEQVDRFVDMTLAVEDAAEVMPLVQDHLERCGNCREEFEALLAALRALA